MCRRGDGAEPSAALRADNLSAAKARRQREPPAAGKRHQHRVKKRGSQASVHRQRHVKQRHENQEEK